jgi:S-adenosylmethionine hydrolase
MKGVILGIQPEAGIVDVTHGVPPQDVACAAYHLSNAWHHFPAGTIHVAVVDPGVGSSRRALAIEAGGHTFLAPDNGLLTPALRGAGGWRAVAITVPRYLAPTPSHTFHGRDIFAPAAAHLARGTALGDLGDPVSDPIVLPDDPPFVEGRTVRARVIHVDRFGNAVLNVDRALLGRAAGGREISKLTSELGGRTIDRFVTHYAAGGDVPCFLINSDGRLELALPGGDAAGALGIGLGTPVVFQLVT